MVSDQEIAKCVETVLRQSDPNAVTSLDGIVQQLEAKLGLDLSHKAAFIRDQINLNLLRSRTLPQPPKDNFAFQHHPQFHPQHPFPSHFALHHPRPHCQELPHDLNFGHPQNVAPVPSETPKESAPAGVKRRGGAGGLNKVCGVSRELQAIVGEPALPRTEIVKKLWAYIRKHNLQDPSNKRKIICDDALRVVFETDCTDMFKMNKLLAKHILPMDTKDAEKSKRLKVDVEATAGTTVSSQSFVKISEALAKFLGIDKTEMVQSEAEQRIWDYIRVNQLEDPLNSMVVLCDEKLHELLGCESISTLGVREMLKRHHLFEQ